MFSKLKRILHPENMLFKMIILNCGLLLLVTLVLTAAGNYIYEESIAERSYANTMEIQNQVLKSLDLIFKSVEDNVEALGNYPEVQEYLKVDVENQQASRVELERQVRDLLLDYSRIYSEYLNIVVVSEKGQYLSNDSYRVKKLPLTEEKWYQDAVLANGELVLSPTSLGRNLKAWKNYSTDNYVSTAKLICDRQTSAGIGVILIDLDLKSIQNLVEDITMGQTGFGYIQDSQGHVLYAPQNEVVYRMNPNWVTDGESGRVRCRIKGKDYNVIYSHSKYTDLTAVGVFDWGKTIEGISRARTVSKWIAVIIMIFAAGATVIFSASITRPISTLSKLMKKAQTGDMTVRFENHYKGEIGQLGDSFNAMVEKINELLGVVYKEQKNKREAELKILHEQIKPHFLYNTLDTIVWLIEGGMNEDAVEMISSLSIFFRTSLSKGNDIIPLSEEERHTLSYLEIQQFRYHDILEFEISIPKELGSVQVPKLSIQPLAENALYHGIKNRRGKGKITITGREEENAIVLTVSDNGQGMTPERLHEVQEAIRTGERAGFGLAAVAERIALYYGPGYGMTISSEEGVGTTVEIRLGKNIQPKS